METWEDFEQASEQGGIAKVAEEFKSVSKQIEDLEERRDKLKAMLEGVLSRYGRAKQTSWFLSYHT